MRLPTPDSNHPSVDPAGRPLILPRRRPPFFQFHNSNNKTVLTVSAVVKQGPMGNTPIRGCEFLPGICTCVPPTRAIGPELCTRLGLHSTKYGKANGQRQLSKERIRGILVRLQAKAVHDTTKSSASSRQVWMLHEDSRHRVDFDWKCVMLVVIPLH